MSVESTGQAVMFELSNRCLLLVSIAFPDVSIGEKAQHFSLVDTYKLGAEYMLLR